MRIIMIIFYLTLIVIGVSFAALNAQSISLNFYVTSVNIPISVLIASVLTTGMIIGFLFGICKYWRLKMLYRKISHRLEITEKEIKNLRSIPLYDQH